MGRCLRTPAVLIFLVVAGGALHGQDQEALYRGKPVKAWKAILKQGDARQRLLAILALGEAGHDAVAALPELSGVLKDRNVLLRRAAVQTLAGLGNDAAPAVSGLALALRDSDPLVRQLAAQALGAIGDLAVPPLLAAITLGEIGPDAADAIPALKKMNRDGATAEVRKIAEAALAKIQP